jgi:hypothetical protein
MECRKKLSGLDNDLSAVAARIMMMGGVVVPYESLAKLRREHTRLAESLKSSLDRILETGCVIKDLDVGLLDFPSIIDNEEVYLCWKLGEDRIRYYHRQDETSLAANLDRSAGRGQATRCNRPPQLKFLKYFISS